MEEQQNTAMSIFDYLFDEGDFEIILQRIFLYLDAASLESCGLVCKRWRKFILRLFQRQVSLQLIFLWFATFPNQNPQSQIGILTFSQITYKTWVSMINEIYNITSDTRGKLAN